MFEPERLGYDLFMIEKNRRSKSVGLIPARADSKRLPRKNIKLLHGKPLIAHTIECARQCSLLDRVIVSTEDMEIAKIALEYGAEVPFLRSADLAGDTTSDKDLWVDFIKRLRAEEDYSFDYLVYLRPTVPLRTPESIESAIKEMESNPSLSGLRSVTAATGVHHPFWQVKLIDKRLKPFIDGVEVASKYYQSQLLPPCYRLNGVVDVVKPGVVLAENDPYGPEIGYIELDEYQAVDIDTGFDFELYEFLLSRG